MTVDVELPGASTVTTCLFLRLDSELGINVIVIEAMKPLASTSDGSSQETFMWVPFKRVVCTSLGATVGAAKKRPTTVTSCGLRVFVKY